MRVRLCGPRQEAHVRDRPKDPLLVSTSVTTGLPQGAQG